MEENPYGHVASHIVERVAQRRQDIAHESSGGVNPSWDQLQPQGQHALRDESQEWLRAAFETGEIRLVEQPPTRRRGGGLTVADVNSGPGWYEVINPRNATTCIAHVYEDGTLYLPEGEGTLTPDEFTFAAARGRAHRLVRADELQPKEA